MKKSPKSSQALEKKIEKAEKEIMKKKESLAKLRKKLPRTKFEDFRLIQSNGKETTLSKLFGKQNELMVIHNMGQGCPFCALWADAFNGVLKHLQSRLAVVMESPDAPSVQKKVLARQGWNFNMVSSEGSHFREDAGFEEDGDPAPGVSIFIRDKKGDIYQTSKAIFGPGDNYCSVWDLLELLPKGADGWFPKFINQY